MMNPQGSGSSACVSVHVDSKLAARAERALSAWARGHVHGRVPRDHDGTAWFMELNRRAWGGMAPARPGLEYPAWTIRQLDEPGLKPLVDGGNANFAVISAECSYIS
jgi:hypothetical protein